MLRAALIGFSSSGKTTLFQLMTSVRESARGTGKGETLVGISKVPDERFTLAARPAGRLAEARHELEERGLAAGTETDEGCPKHENPAS